MNTFKQIKDSGTILISGVDKQGTQYMFGAFIPTPSLDEQAIQDREHPHWERALLFQLSPVHDVFRGIAGKPAWVVDGESVRFGDVESGAALVVSEGLRRAKFTQRVGGMREEETYRATGWRGDWGVDMRVEGIEVWEEGDNE